MESIYFKKQWYEISETMSEAGRALRAAIIEYQFTGKEPEATSPVGPVFALIKNDIDRQREQTRKAEERRAKRKPAKYSRLVHRKPAAPAPEPAAAPEKIPEPSAAPAPAVPETKEEPKPEKEAKRFVKPTVEQIAAYCKEKNYNVDAERFYAYYESKGWKIGRAPMKSWQAALITWTRNNFDDTAKKSAGSAFQTADKMNEAQVKDYADTTAEAPLW